MEKISGLRAIGNGSAENKEKAKEELTKKLYYQNELFSDEEKELLNKIEKEKTIEEKEMITLVNQEINDIRKEMGLDPFTIPMDNYRMMDQDFYEENFEGSSAMMSFPKQVILFDESWMRESLIGFMSTSLHESLHLNGHITLEVNEDSHGEIETTHSRQGMGVLAVQKKGLHGEFHRHFDGLHEAIVSEQQRRSLENLIHHPMLQKEREILFSEKVESLKNKIVQNYPEVQKEDIVWVSEDGENFQSINYQKPRKVLNFVCNKIFEKFPDNFKSQDEVFKLFLKAQFTGQLLETARLVESVFGEGSFRRLGDMETDNDSAIKTYEALRRKS